MPVVKFRSVEDMDLHRHERGLRAGDPGWPRWIARIWERSARLCPREFPRGVHRYRSVEEAAEARERWLMEHVQELQRRRRRR